MSLYNCIQWSHIFNYEQNLPSILVTIYLWTLVLQKLNADGSGILIHYTTIFGTKFSPKKSGFLQKSTLGKHTMKNWIILWFWNIANPFTSKDLYVNLKEDVNFVKLQVFKSWKKSCWIFKTYNSKNQHIFKISKEFLFCKGFAIFQNYKKMQFFILSWTKVDFLIKPDFLGENLVPKIVV